MMFGKTYNSGEVVLAQVQFTDTFEVKKRPCVVLFEDMENVVVAGVTSNLKMKGIPLTVKEGAVKESVIKLNHLFTISHAMVKKVLFILSKEKKKQIYNELSNSLVDLKS